MLLNLSNHPYSQWLENQKLLAKQKFGSVTDMLFPEIDPILTSDEILKMAVDYKEKILQIISFSQKSIHNENHAVHIMGELTFCFTLVALLQKVNICCVASTTRRVVVQSGNVKNATFIFCSFRQYPDFSIE